MNAKLSFLLLAGFLLVGVYSLQGQSLEDKVLNALNPLDTAYMTSERLYERSITYVDLPRFDGHALNDSTFMLGKSFPSAFDFLNERCLRPLFQDRNS